MKLKKISYFFFNFQKIGSGGSVKRKIKKLWPKLELPTKAGKVILTNKKNLFFCIQHRLISSLFLTAYR